MPRSRARRAQRSAVGAFEQLFAMRTRSERFVGADRDRRRPPEPAERARVADGLLAELDSEGRQPAQRGEGLLLGPACVRVDAQPNGRTGRIADHRGAGKVVLESAPCHLQLHGAEAALRGGTRFAGESGSVSRTEQCARGNFPAGVFREEPGERQLAPPREIVEERKLDPETRRRGKAVEKSFDVVDGLWRGRAGESGAGGIERRRALGERFGAERGQGRRLAPAGADPDLESVAPLDRSMRGLERGPQRQGVRSEAQLHRQSPMASNAP